MNGGVERLGTVRFAGVLAVAAVLFGLLFRTPSLGFWPQLAATSSALALLAGLHDGRPLLRLFDDGRVRPVWALGWGLVSAALLYGVFAAGRAASAAMFPSSVHMVGAVYRLGGDTAAWKIAVLLGVLVGPCEEIFWRGYVQRRLARRFGWKGVAAAVAAYTLVHVPSGNPMLVTAALVCGAFWGICFARYRSLALNMVSHAVWTTTVFVLAPLGA